MSFSSVEEGQMSKKERRYAVKYLESTMNELFKTVRNLNSDQWNYKPADGGWTVAGVAEHLLIAEQGFHGLISKRILSNEEYKTVPTDAEKKTNDQVIEFIRDRSPDKRVKTIPSAEPKGVIKSPSEFMSKYQTARNLFKNYVSNTDDELNGYYFEGPAGTISAYQWVLLASAHTERHMAQMKEVIESASFPRQ